MVGNCIFKKVHVQITNKTTVRNEWKLNSADCRIKMVGGRVAHPVLKGPSVVKELIIGSVLGLAAGGLWKMHHWNEQRKSRAFYDLLEKGEISVVVQE
ncbi:hypothetical protein Ccrd_002633 [Cynara cardunculus var. scolymus]|uniref:Cytochrome c oxidase subunit 5C n=2 Tax=Cynara cardunculus var. scolymus TaxID=59895 RepID=A0A103XR53_CYNCS|nr:hypothetical protein Ccrd_002633 [Cynara cardunculus var. scolymus]